MKYLRFLLAVASGLLLASAFPPYDLGWMVWIWMFPLLFALWSGSPKRGLKKSRWAWLKPFFLGWVSGFAFFIVTLAWIRHSGRVIYGARGNEWMGWGVESLGWAAAGGLSGFISLYWGIWAVFASTIGRPRLSGMLDRKNTPGAMFDLSIESLRSAFLNAAAWAGLEWVRGTLFSGFGWDGVGVPLISELALVQSADIVGINGLSFLPVFCTCILYNTVLRFHEEVRVSKVRPHLDFFVAAVLVLGDFVYGFQLLSAPQHGETVPLRTLMVQINMPEADIMRGDRMEESRETYDKLTRLFVATQHPDLVIWPESALGHSLFTAENVKFLNDLLASGDFSLLAGTDILLPNEPPYTGAVLLKGTVNNYQFYRKIHLVPYGEYLPGRSIWLVNKLLGDILPGDFASGTSMEPLKLEKPAGVQIIPLVCFEDTVDELARQFVRDAPQLLVNCTNDGWFLHSIQNEQHLMNARFRCVELHRPMVRAANTGVTCYVGPDGRMNRGDRLQDPKTGSVFIKGALPKEVQLLKHPPMTFYAEHGDLFSIIMLVIAGLAVPLAMFMSRSAAATGSE